MADTDNKNKQSMMESLAQQGKKDLTNIIDNMDNSDVFQIIKDGQIMKDGSDFIKDLSEFALAVRTGNWPQIILEAEELAKDISALVKDGTDLAAAVENDYKDIKNFYNEVSGEVSKITEDLQNDVNIIAKDGKEVLEAGKEVWGATVELVEDIGKGIADGNFQEISNAFSDFSHNITEGEVKKSIDKAKDSIQEAIDTSGKGIKEITDAIDHMKDAKIFTENEQEKDDNRTPEQIASDLKNAGVEDKGSVKSDEAGKGEVIGGNKSQSNDPGISI